MNLMLFFGEKFNALLWYVCSQIKHIKMYWGMNLIIFLVKNLMLGNEVWIAKSLAVELAPPHAQSAWGSRGKSVRAAGLAACCNYFSKKKKVWI